MLAAERFSARRFHRSPSCHKLAAGPHPPGESHVFHPPGVRMTTLSLAMIVRNEGQTIERVLDCAKAFADEMVVVDTGSTDDTIAKAKAKGAQVHYFSWIDDFAAARNLSFSRCAGDWIIWLDGDDLISPDNQKRILDLKQTVLNDELEAVYLRYVYPPFRQWRERMARRDLFVEGKLKWKEPVHEFIDGVDGRKVRYFDDIVIQHDTPPDRHRLKKDRNISILRKHVANGATDDRSLYIYAIECLHSLLKDEGEQVLARFFSQVRIPEYRYEICCKMYDFYTYFNEPQRALEALSKAIVEDPSRAEAYYKLGRSMMKADRPVAAIPLLALSGMIPLPGYGTPEAEAYAYGPWESLAHAHFRLEQWDAAAQSARKALERLAARDKMARGTRGLGARICARGSAARMAGMDRRQPRQEYSALDGRPDPGGKPLRPESNPIGFDAVRPEAGRGKGVISGNMTIA
jgi:glycosyltransferase involved in cell wall biosynthesis